MKHFSHLLVKSRTFYQHGDVGDFEDLRPQIANETPETNDNIEHLLRAHDDAEALYSLGTYYWRHSDPQNAYAYWLEASRRNNPKAQCCLGFCYRNGVGITENILESNMWYTRAAEQGDAEAQYSLGYYLWDETPDDRTEAINWIRRAADQGYTRAIAFLRQHNL